MSRRVWGLSLGGLLCGLLVLLLVAGDLLSRPASREVGQPPAALGAQTVRLPTVPGQFVVGWFARGQAQGAVLLLHGVRGDRRQMTQRALFLQQAGYATLQIDLPAHGESSGERITFGAREAAGVEAAVRFLRQTLPGVRIAVIGVSLGAASTVLAGLDPAPQAVILESMYPTIDEAVQDRLAMRLGPAGAWLAPLLLWQLPLRVGLSAEALRPIEHLPRLGAPVLIASGADDLHTLWPETQRLFDAAAAPKVLWKVEGAAHVDLYDHAPEPYRQRVLEFLAQHLRGSAARPAH